MVNKRASRIRKGNPEKGEFVDLLHRAPQIKSFRRVSIVGVLFQSDREGKFVIQTTNGMFYELDVDSVERHSLVEQKGEFVVVEVQLPAYQLAEDANAAKAFLEHERALAGAADPSTSEPPAQWFQHVSPLVAHNEVAALASDPIHPVRKYWRMEAPERSPFQEYGHPFNKSTKEDSTH